jgi:hypothetical protein
MTRATFVGLCLSLLGLVGYTVGAFVAYPGRAFSITAFIAGVALVAVFRDTGGETA